VRNAHQGQILEGISFGYGEHRIESSSALFQAVNMYNLYIHARLFVDEYDYRDKASRKVTASLRQGDQGINGARGIIAFGDAMSHSGYLR
jgi:hypothetical protein